MSNTPGALANVEPSEPVAPAENTSGAGGSFLTEIRSSGAGAEGAIPSEPVAMPSRFRISGPTALVLVVAAVGIGALLGMRKLTNAGAAMASVNIDYTPGQRTAAQAHKRLVEVLDRSSTPVQVPTDQIKKNPFQLAVAPQTAPTPDTADDKTALEEARRNAAAIAARQKLIADKLGSLMVNGVMDGARPVARINGEMVQVGDTIADGLFTVTAIGGRAVTVQADGKEYELTMLETTGNSKSPRRR